MVCSVSSCGCFIYIIYADLRCKDNVNGDDGALRLLKIEQKEHLSNDFDNSADDKSDYLCRCDKGVTYVKREA